MAKGMVFGAENPECVVEALWDEYPEAKPTGVSQKKAFAAATAEVASRMEKGIPVADDRWGDQGREGIELALKVYNTSETQIGVDDVWTDKFISQANDFDHEEIRKTAKSETCN